MSATRKARGGWAQRKPRFAVGDVVELKVRIRVPFDGRFFTALPGTRWLIVEVGRESPRHVYRYTLQERILGRVRKAESRIRGKVT
ncbi:MAG: hypothetical protein KF873_02070 [Gemmataceae bacterium]|nr:hypothetical protein [Gemmataceae bacterium]